MQNQPQPPTHTQNRNPYHTTTSQKPFIKIKKHQKHSKQKGETKLEFQKKKKHFKIIFILTTITLFLLLNKILFYSQPSTFTKTQTEPISITSTDELKELFRKNMFPKTYIHHIIL
ncbi:hypothetical protein [Candidatus Phytoplasma meliae]|uniref:Uncharacterized protein n=1 Tax=Candidatus Phytoplasma meliae TaxID=1848402 RepID=A0ABS5CYR0_9MOLU|nr:hypothetical protein [Candidatus Phytoplasma meliae]MBP5836107.1 hypothetical protein [Candidatus Phytoplasma meliae]